MSDSNPQFDEVKEVARPLLKKAIADAIVKTKDKDPHLVYCALMHELIANLGRLAADLGYNADVEDALLDLITHEIGNAYAFYQERNRIRRFEKQKDLKSARCQGTA